MLSLLGKEINEFLDSLIAYVVMGVFLTGIGLLTWVFPETNVLDYGYATMETLFTLGPYVLMFLIPAITMRSFAEEKRTGTIELLFTMPLRPIAIVMAKFLAGFLLVIVSILPTLIYFFSLQQLGNPPGNLDTPGIMGSYMGLILLGGVFTAVGMLASALSRNQILSFILAAFLCFFLYAGFDSLAGWWPAQSRTIEQLGILDHYVSMSRGLIDLRDLTYFFGLSYLMLLCTALVIRTK